MFQKKTYVGAENWCIALWCFGFQRQLEDVSVHEVLLWRLDLLLMIICGMVVM
jgi:hypothetical protein